ncbi:hypothetical protein TNCV_2382151 [Trichonephila clavipes]|nr:hypothetical protein TNCV_2382151 [Trichonephila clavipes]
MRKPKSKAASSRAGATNQTRTKNFWTLERREEREKRTREVLMLHHNHSGAISFKCFRFKCDENSSYDLPHAAVETKEKRNRFEQTSEELYEEENIDASTKRINLLKRRLYACETMCFLWNLPDVEEVRYMMEKHLVQQNLLHLVSMEIPLRCRYVCGQNGRCGMPAKSRQRPARAGAAKATRNLRNSGRETRTLGHRAEKERKENARGARAGAYTFS